MLQIDQPRWAFRKDVTRLMKNLHIRAISYRFEESFTEIERIERALLTVGQRTLVFWII